MPSTTWTDHQSEKTTSPPEVEAPPGEGVERILAGLDGVEETASGWQALCPVHDDRAPSLSITEKDGKVLIYCHAGCLTQDIVEAIGLTMSDLFPAVEVPEAVQYIYADEYGTPLYMVDRSYDKRGNKTFRQYSFDGENFVLGHMDGVRRVPYQLPEVLAGIAVGNPVHIVEGEKDVDRLREFGLVATCNSGGAGQGEWTRWAPMFNGARVILWPDNDIAGRRHMEVVARALIEETRELLVATLPNLKDKGDVSDFLDDGGTLDDLANLMADYWSPTDMPAEDVLEMDATDGFRLTEVGNAHRLVTLAKGELRYVHAWGKFLVYKDGRYIVDTKNVEVTGLAKQIPVEMLANLPAPGTRILPTGFNGALEDQRDPNGSGRSGPSRVT